MKVSSDKKTVTVIFLVSLLVRVVFVLLYPQFAPDSIVYDTLAVNLNSGLGYTVDGYTPHVLRPPLYPFFLAGLYNIFGHNFTAVRVIQALIDSLTVTLVYKLAKTISGRQKPAVVSASIACFHPELIASTGFLLTETTTTFLLSASAWILLESVRRSRKRLSFMSGVLLALSSLSRPVTLALPGALFITMLLLYRKNGFRSWILLCAGMVLTIAPWTIRNYMAFNAFIPVTVGAGSNLWIGSYAPWDGDYNFKNPDDWLEIKDGLGQIEADRKLKEEALKNISRAPQKYLLLCGKKFFRFWIGIPGSKKLLVGKPFLTGFLFLVHYIILILFAAGFLSKELRPSRERWIPITIILYFTLLHAVMFAIPRYRIPIIPMTLVFCGVSACKLICKRETV